MLSKEMLAAVPKEDAARGWELIKDDLFAGTVPEDLREDVGWALYRYMKFALGALDSVTARRLLAEYLKIATGRPSLLHSLMLKLAVKVARTSADFNFYRFYRMWNPALFRDEDYMSADVGDKHIPSLVTLCVVRASGYPESGGLSKLLDEVDKNRIDRGDLLRVMRRRYCRDVEAAMERKDMPSVERLLTEYAETLCRGGVSGHHSKMLEHACKYYVGERGEGFLRFFRIWLSSGFRDEDWRGEIGKEGRHYAGTAERALKRIFDIIKADPRNQRGLLEEMLPLFEQGARRETTGYWMRYRYGRLLLLRGDKVAAERVLRMVEAPMRRNWFYWVDMADCADDTDVMLMHLDKAARMVRVERFEAPLHIRRCEGYLRKEMAAEAREALERARSIRAKFGYNAGGKIERLERQITALENKN